MFLVAGMVCRSLGKRPGTKFCFWGLPEDPKMIIPDPFHEEKGGMTTTRQLRDNMTTTLKYPVPESGQPPSSSHSVMKYLVRTSPHFDHGLYEIPTKFCSQVKACAQICS